MSLGNYGVNNNSGFNNNKKSDDRTYYSRLNFRNYNGDSQNFTYNMSIQFSLGLMKIKIDERQGDNSYKELESIFLSPTKALMLAEELKKFKAMYTSGNITSTMYGVNGGMKEIISFIGVFSKDNNIIIRIGKFRADSGDVVSSVDFQLSNGVCNADEWDNPEEFTNITLVPYQFAEFDQIIIACEEFVRSMNGANAYSILDLGRYDYNRMSNKFDQIFDKLGIERYSSNNGGGNRYTGSSFLSNAANNSGNNSGMYGSNNSKSVSLDSIEDMFDEE